MPEGLVTRLDHERLCGFLAAFAANEVEHLLAELGMEADR
jgi:hypothetical protein